MCHFGSKALIINYNYRIFFKAMPMIDVRILCILEFIIYFMHDQDYKFSINFNYMSKYKFDIDSKIDISINLMPTINDQLHIHKTIQIVVDKVKYANFTSVIKYYTKLAIIAYK